MFRNMGLVMTVGKIWRLVVVETSFVLICKCYRMCFRPPKHRDALSIEWIDPQRVTRMTGYKRRKPILFKPLFISYSGELDLSNKPVAETLLYRVVNERIRSKKNWEDIPAIKEAKDKIMEGKKVLRSKSIEQLNLHLQFLDEVIEGIRKTGYLSRQQQLRRNEWTKVIKNPQSPLRNPWFFKYDEIVVDVSQDGEYLFVDGLHRFAIAQILRIPLIPVRVRLRHKLQNKEQL